MQRILPGILVILLLLTSKGQAQTPGSPPFLKENYDGIPFENFVREVEKIHQLHFFFDKEWVSGAVIRQTHAPASLLHVLKETFAPLSLDPVLLYNKYVVIVNAGVPDGERPWHTLSGFVKDGETGQGMPGSSVSVSDMNTTVSTDDNGFFSVKVPAGIHHVFISAVGSIQAYRVVRMNKDILFDVDMFRHVTELEEVEISGNVIQPVNTLDLGTQQLTKENIRIIPPLFGELDIVRSVLSLPGVKSVGEGASGFNVRGGNVDQNLILIDNAPLFNSSHLFGLFSVVNSESVSGLTLHKGTMPARYGGRLSSVLDITFQDGLTQLLSFEGSLGAISSKIRFSSPLVKDKTSIAVAARGAYPNWMLAIVPDETIKESRASFYDISTKVAHRFDSRNFLSLTVHGSRDAFRLGADTTYKWSGKLASFQYSHIFSEKAGSHFSAFYSKSENDVTANGFADGFELTSSIETTGMQFNVSWDVSPVHHVEAGVESNLTIVGRGHLKPSGTESVLNATSIPDERGMESAVHISDAITLTPTVSLYAGVRLSSFLFLGPAVNRTYQRGLPKNESTVVGNEVLPAGKIGKSYFNAEPRVAARLLLDTESSVKVGYNRNFQYLSLLSNTASVSPVDTWKLSDTHLKPQASDQFSAGYFRNLFNNTYEASVELYYRSFSSLTQYKEGARLILNEHIETDLLQGSGKAYGAEFYIRKNRGKLTGWLGYTYSRAFVRVKGNFEEETLSGGEYFPSNFDKPNDVNVVLNYAVSKKTSVSGNFVYTTGRPITYPESVYVMNGYAVANYGAINQARIPDYHRLDLSVNHSMLPKRTRKFETSWSLGAYNAYARKNPFSVFFKSEYSGKYPQAYRLSVLGTIIPYFAFNFKIK